MARPGVTLLATITARPEKREAVLALLHSFIEPTRAETGNVNYDLHVDAADPNVFVFYENFVDRAALDLHSKAPYLTLNGALADELLARPTEVRFLNMLSDPAKREMQK